MFKWLFDLFKKDNGPYLPPSPTPSAKAPTPEPHPTGQELPDYMSGGMLKVGIVVGHNRKAPGAKLNHPSGLYEYDYNLEVARTIKEIAPKNVQVEVIQREPDKTFSAEVRDAYQQAIDSLCDCVIELHFNAFNGEAKGTATLCSPDLSDVDFAHVIHRAMIQFFERGGADDRGVKTISKASRGGVNVNSFPGGVNCLVEPFFGDNKEEAEMAMQKRAKYAKCLLDAVMLWGKKVDLIK